MSTSLPPPPAPPHPPAGQPAPPAPPRRLVRLTDQGKVAGVAAGLGWYLGVDPVLVRIGFVVLTIATGAGIPAYLIAWWLVPAVRSGEATAPQAPGQRDTRSLLVVGAALLGLVVLLGQVDLFSGQVLGAAALIGVGVLLFTDGERRRAVAPPPWVGAPVAPGAPPPAPPLPPQPPAAPAPPVGPSADPPPAAWESAYAPYRGAWREAPHGHDGRPRRPRTILPLFGVGSWFAAMGLATLLDRTGAVALTPTAVVGITLAVIGGTLLVGTLFGRARGLIGLGVAGSLLLLPLSAVGASGVDLGAGFGERVHIPQVVEDVADPFQLVAGAQTIDLTELDLGGRAVAVDVDMVAGELLVRVPDDVEVDVSGTLRAGERSIFGAESEGTDLSLTGHQAAPEAGGRIDLRLSMGLGQVTVESVPAPGPR